ncbi:MAG: haloacid dehalogenase [Candidatus Bathyarchaeia archaeon]
MRVPTWCKFVSKLEEIFAKLEHTLSEKDSVRDSIQETARSIIRLSKTVLGLIHRGLLEEAKLEADKFSSLLVNLEKLRSLHEEFYFSNLIADAYQEYCEARVLLTYLSESRIPNWEELRSPPISYLLGLLDMVGELRRLTLDCIRRGDIDAAERFLKTMDDIYYESMKIDSPYALSVGLRRKLDIARKIIETTRGDLIFEIRRSKLEQALRNLEDVIRRHEAS